MVMETEEVHTLLFQIIHKQMIHFIQVGHEEAAYLATRLLCLHLRKNCKGDA